MSKMCIFNDANYTSLFLLLMQTIIIQCFTRFSFFANSYPQSIYYTFTKTNPAATKLPFWLSSNCRFLISGVFENVNTKKVLWQHLRKNQPGAFSYVTTKIDLIDSISINKEFLLNFATVFHTNTISGRNSGRFPIASLFIAQGLQR